MAGAWKGVGFVTGEGWEGVEVCDRRVVGGGGGL